MTIKKCNCEGCQRAAQNLGGYQPCANASDNGGTPPALSPVPTNTKHLYPPLSEWPSWALCATTDDDGQKVYWAKSACELEGGTWRQKGFSRSQYVYFQGILNDAANSKVTREEQAQRDAQADQPAVDPIGTKRDQDKIQLHLLPPRAELMIGEVLTFGAKKYSPNGWKYVENPNDRYMAAAMRHLNSARQGEQLDAESGLPHLAHAACCLMFILEHNSHPFTEVGEDHE